jgi:hypothetical protein
MRVFFGSACHIVREFAATWNGPRPLAVRTGNPVVLDITLLGSVADAWPLAARAAAHTAAAEWRRVLTVAGGGAKLMR